MSANNGKKANHSRTLLENPPEHMMKAVWCTKPHASISEHTNNPLAL
jgi:hypothetical protein